MTGRPRRSGLGDQVENRARNPNAGTGFTPAPVFGWITEARPPAGGPSSPNAASWPRGKVWTACASNCTPKPCGVDWARRQCAGYRRRGGVDLAFGRRPLAASASATGLLPCRATPGRRGPGALWRKPRKAQGLAQALDRQLKHQSSLKVIRQLEEVLAAMPAGAATQAVAKEVEYFHQHQERMDYRAGRRAGEPIGSGPVEATCRQTQCRFKRPGQFWSQAGDEALMCLEMFCERPRHLFPHSSFNPAKTEMRARRQQNSPNPFGFSLVCLLLQRHAPASPPQAKPRPNQDTFSLAGEFNQ